jgi:RNA polymerase sigma factor (sigma-70 family)
LDVKKTYSSAKELEELNPEALKPGHWAVVDEKGKYDVFQYNPDKDGKLKWTRLDEPSNAIMSRLKETSTNYTLDTIRNVYKDQFKKMYGDIDHLGALNKPVESIVSFRAPFTQASYDINVPDAGPAWDRWLGKQPEVAKNNRGPTVPGGDEPLEGGMKSMPTKTPDGGAPQMKWSEEVEANADAWGLRNADGTIKQSKVGENATRFLHQAAKVFGKEAVETWDIIETAGVGAARLAGVEPEEFFKRLDVGTGTAEDLKSLQEGKGLEQAARASTETPEFKQWFGDWQASPEAASKVVDASGKPLRVFHGNAGGVDGGVFRIPEAKGDFPEPGVFFTENPDLASVYAAEGSAVRETLRKPDWIKIKDKDWNAMDIQQQRSAIEKEVGAEPPRVDYTEAVEVERAAKDLSGWMYREFDDLDHWEDGWSRMTRGESQAFAEETLEKIREKHSKSGNTVGLRVLKKIEDAIKKGGVKYNEDTGRLVSPPKLESLAKDLQDGISARSTWERRHYDAKDVRPERVRDAKHPSVVPAYLDIKNPYVINYEGRPFRPATAANAIADAKAGGHDGVIIHSVRDDAKGMGNNPRFLASQYIVFSPNQIKSATGNSGAFDAANPSILAQKTEAAANGAIFINGTRMSIKAFQTGDVSTLHHEFGHAIRQMLGGDTLSSAQEAIGNRMKSLGMDAKVLEADGKTWTREAEEVWARSWERFLKDGVSPVPELTGVFTKIKDFLVELYKKISMDPALEKTLDPNTKAIFDKIIREGNEGLRGKPAAKAKKGRKPKNAAKASNASPAASGTPAAPATAATAAKAVDDVPGAANAAPETPGGSIVPEGMLDESPESSAAEIARRMEERPVATPSDVDILTGKTATPPATAASNPIVEAASTGKKRKGKKAAAAASAAAAAKVADEIAPQADIADDVAAELSKKAPQVDAVDDAPYTPPAVDSVDAAMKEIDDNRMRSTVLDVLDRAPEELKAAIEDQVRLQYPDLYALVRKPVSEAVEAPRVGGAVDELAPQSGEQVDGLQRAKGKPRSIEDRLPREGAGGTGVAAAIEEAAPVVPQENPLIKAKKGRGKPAKAATTKTPKNPLVEKTSPQAKAPPQVAASVSDGQAVMSGVSKQASNIRAVMRGDADTLEELFQGDKARIAATLERMGTERGFLGKARVLAEALGYPEPDEVARTVVEAAEESLAAAAKAMPADVVEKLEKVNSLIAKADVLEELNKLDAIDDHSLVDGMAKNVLREAVGKVAKVSPEKADEQFSKMHNLLMEYNEKYAEAVARLKKPAQAELPIDNATLKARANVIDDPDFATVPESDILSPAPERIKAGKDVTDAMVSENERLVDKHLFRKLNYLKKAGRTKEADAVVDEIANHYVNTGLIKFAARKAMRGNNPSQMDEFMSMGRYNLLAAIHEFDHTKNLKFSTFATNALAYKNLDIYRKKGLKTLAKGGLGDEAPRIFDNAVQGTADDAPNIAVGDISKYIATPRQAEVMRLVAEGLTQAEIAEKVGVSVKTVQTDIKKASAAIQKKIFWQANTPKPPKSAMRLLYEQNAEAISEVMKNIEDESLRAKYTNMLDIGEHLFASSAPVRAFNRYFDRSVYGQYDYDAQKLARKRYRAAQRAIFESRELMSAVTKAVGQYGFLDEYEATRGFIKDGMKTADAKKQARDLINKRNSEIVRYMEGKELGKGAIDRDGVASGLSRELFGGEETAKKMEGLFDAVKQFFPRRLYEEGMAGLSNRKLIDEYIEYFPRVRHYAYGSSRKSIDDIEQLFDTSLSSQRKRKMAFRDVPGGRAVLDELSVDPDISGIYWKQLMLGKTITRKMLDTAREKLLTPQYRARIFDEAKHFDETGKLNKEGILKGNQVVAAMAQLPPEHVEKNIPIFGNNILHDISKYIQDSIAMEGVARSAQEIVADNIVPIDKPTQWTLTRLFKDIGLDRNQAYVNVIESTGNRKLYNEYVRDRVKSIKAKLAKGEEFPYNKGNSKLSLTKDGKIQVVDIEDVAKAEGDEIVTAATPSAPRILKESDLAEELSMARDFTEKQKMSVNKDTFDVATQYMTAWRTPKPMNDVSKFFRAMMNLFKTNVTLPHLAFHIRNFISGQAQNYFYGAYDPTAKGLGKYSFGRYLKPLRQARTMRNGQTIKGLYDELPDQIKRLVDDYGDGASQDEMATNWVRQQVFKYGITGDKQGYAAEQLGESYSAFVSQYPGYKQRELTAKNLYGLLRDPQVGVSAKDRLNLLHTRGGGRPDIVTDELGKKRIGIKQYEETTSTLHRTGEDLAAATEDLNRITPFLAFLKQGTLPEEAARKVQRIQIDYSDLSEFEKSVRNIVPFYTFSSKIMHLTLGDLITNPGGKQAWAIRATNRAQDPGSLAPDHIKRGVAIPVGETATGADRYVSGLGLPFEDPLQFAGALRGDFRGTFGEMAGRLRPEIQAFSEAVTGRSLFFDRDLEDMDPPIGRLMSNIQQGITGEERTGLAEPVLNSPTLEWLVGKSPASRYVNTLTKLTDSRKDLLPKLANIASGVKVTDVEPEARERIAIDMASKLLKEYGGREMSLTYVPEWAKERLSEERIAQMEAIQQFISQVQKETRSRKKAAEGLAGAVAGAAGDFQQ